MHRIFKLSWVHVELLLSKDLMVQNYTYRTKKISQTLNGFMYINEK